MSREEILKRLENDNDYYGEFGKQFISNSDIDALINNPAAFKKHEVTLPILQGRYFHTLILEPEKLGDMMIVKASSRNTNIYKDAIAESGEQLLLLEKDIELLKRLADKLMSNFEMYELISYAGNVYEKPAIGEIHGAQWKAKADIFGPEYVIDLKTTGDIGKFKRSAWNYNYDSQAYVYQTLFGKPMVFIVACKETEQIGMYQCSPEFLERGNAKVIDAVIAWNKFYGPDASLDPNDYVKQEIL